MSAPPNNPDPPRNSAFPLKPVFYAAIALLAVSSVVIFIQHTQIKTLQAQLMMASTICPADVFPRDSVTCGTDGKPECGIATWQGSASNGKCRVTELKTGTGCGICYAGQVGPCLISDYKKGCDGQSASCGVRYCIQTSGGAYDWEDLCRPIGAPPP